MEITQKTKQAIIQSAEECVQDLDAGSVGSSMIVAEVAIDAGRLSFSGHTEEDNEVSALIAEHGYGAVLKEIAKFVPTA